MHAVTIAACVGCRVERADEVGVQHLGRPVDAQRARRAVQSLDVARVGRRQRAQQPDAAVDHQRRGGHAGQQGDLRVPLLGGELGAELQLPPVALDRDLLLGQRQRHPAARGLAREPELADLLEQHQRLVGRAVVDGLLDAGVVELRAGPHPRALDVDVGALAGLVDLDRPEQRRADLVGQQRRRALGERRRVQRHLRVGAVERHPALVGLEVDRVAGRDERRDVGDGVVDDVPVAVALEVHRLVEVPRASAGRW